MLSLWALYGLNGIRLLYHFFPLFTSFKWQKDREAEKDAAELGAGNHRRETVSLSRSLTVILLLTVREGVRHVLSDKQQGVLQEVQYKLPEYLEFILREKIF